MNDSSETVQMRKTICKGKDQRGTQKYRMCIRSEKDAKVRDTLGSYKDFKHDLEHWGMGVCRKGSRRRVVLKLNLIRLSVPSTHTQMMAVSRDIHAN